MTEPVVHQQTGSSHGAKSTRCGLEGKEVRASGWASDVTCPECLHPSAAEAPR